MDSSLLRGFERVSVPLCTLINGNRHPRGPLLMLTRYLSGPAIYEVTRRRLHVHGADHVRKLNPARGILVLSNHRSFFDMYVALSWVYVNADFVTRLHFPVRSNFFYTNPLGLVVNLAISGCAMWPPVFRDERRTLLNPTGVTQTLHVLDQKGCMVGIHPEGTRSQDPDPYRFLPARPGVGVMVSRTHPETVILPYFVAGLSNSFAEEMKCNLRPRQSEPLRVWYGEPVLAGEAATWGDPQAIADGLMARIGVEAEKDRAYRPTIGLGAPPVIR